MAPPRRVALFEDSLVTGGQPTWRRWAAIFCSENDWTCRRHTLAVCLLSSLVPVETIGLVGATVFSNVDRTMQMDVVPPTYFNQSVIAVFPRGSQPRDPVEVIKQALQTPPLSLKSADNKIIVASNIKTLETQYKQIVHITKDGFVSGRDFLNNPMDLGSAAGIFL